MRQAPVGRIGSAAVLATLLVLVPGPAAHADCAGGYAPTASPSEARGTTFIGIVTDYRGARGARDAVVTWRIERVYAGGPLPRVLSFPTRPCTTVYVEEGGRYLFSTSRIARPDQADSLAWTLGPEGAVSLWGFGEAVVKYPRSTRRIATLTAALDAVAPDRDTSLPPTDAGVPPPRGLPVGLELLVLLVAAGTGALAWRRRHAGAG